MLMEQDRVHIVHPAKSDHFKEQIIATTHALLFVLQAMTSETLHPQRRKSSIVLVN